MDLRYAARSLRSHPGFTSVAVLTLALGIGANTAIFSIVNGVLLQPLPFPNHDRLFAIQEGIRDSGLIPVSGHHFKRWLDHNRSFEGLSLVYNSSMNLTSNGEPERIPVGAVSASLFSTLGVQPKLGRAFLPSEDQPGQGRVAILSERLWKRRFNEDPSIVGRKISLDGVPYEVVGVLAERPMLPRMKHIVSMPTTDEPAQLWRPIALDFSQLGAVGDHNYGCIGRVKSGVSIAQASADLNVIEESIARSVGPDTKFQANLTPLADQMTGSTRQSLFLLLGAVGVVLLIACVNIASLLLIRATGRRREISIRTAIGATRARLLKQMLVESLTLSALGGAAGIVLAYWILSAVLQQAPVDLPRIEEARIDGTVLLFAMFLAAVTGIIFGLLPAWRLSGMDPQEGLKSSNRSMTEGRHGGRLRSMLVAAEVGLSAVSLIAAGLLLNSFIRLMRVDKGFQAERVLMVDLQLPEVRYPDMSKRSVFVRTMLDRVNSIPGVTAAGISNKMPLTGEGSNNIVILEGGQFSQNDITIVDFRLVSPKYFSAIGIPLTSGRVFSESDEGRQLVMVSTLTAQKLWPNANPLGKRFHLGGTSRPLMEVIGVVGDVRGVSMQKTPNLTVYLPYWQRDRANTTLAIRTATSPAAVSNSVREAIRGLDAELPIQQFRTMEALVDRSVAPRRFQMDLAIIFGIAAAVLASIGVYGVVAYSTAQRTGEMGIRMVLGATTGDVRRLILGQGLKPVLAGLALGIAAALALSRLIRGLLFGVDVADPLTFAAVTAILLVVTGLACYIPALRATRVDPAVALRDE